MRFGERVGEALYTFVAALAIAVGGFAAFFTGQPLIFPSLGPTAYLFFESPMSQMLQALAGTVVVVTGASSGIGRATARFRRARG